MQRPQVDLAVKCRLKPVWMSIRVFSAKYSANILRASALRAGGEKLLPPTPTPLVGPTNLQILATSLVAAQSDEESPGKLFKRTKFTMNAYILHFAGSIRLFSIIARCSSKIGMKLKGHCTFVVSVLLLMC